MCYVQMRFTISMHEIEPKALNSTLSFPFLSFRSVLLSFVSCYIISFLKIS